MESEKLNLKSEEERRARVLLLAKKIDEMMEKWEEENGITPEYYEDLLKQHFRSSKPNATNDLLKKIREARSL